jgi:cell division protease FtsH
MAWHGQQQVFLGEDLMTSGREYSDSTAKMLDDEISRILREQEERAHQLLTKHRKGLDLVAEALLEQETIDGPTVGRLVQQALDSPAATEAPIA